MTSPRPADTVHPLTPPADLSPPGPTQSSTQPTSTTQVEALLAQPLTSLGDDGTSKRPRDHRLIHLLLASHGVAAYQERVPLQLMDFAYRYTSSVLSDAQHVQQEGYDQSGSAAEASGKGRGRGGGANKANAAEEGDISIAALRMAIASRMSYQFQGSLPKEFLKGLAEERNRVGLNIGVKRDGNYMSGVWLPPEKYTLTGLGWGVKDEWDSEGEEEIAMNATQDAGEPDVDMGLDGAADEAEDEEGEGQMEDIFGGSPADSGGGGGDAEMGDV